MSTLCDFSQSRRSRLGEAVLWATAVTVMLSVHAGAAIYLMQPVAPVQSEDGPPPAFMIEMAALPEAMNTEETTDNNDAADSAEVQSDTIEPVEEIPPPEPIIEEVKLPEPEPAPVPEPVQEIAKPEPVEMPEPIEEIDPVENQMLAALENVEVPLPVLRPPPPAPVEKKVVERKPAPKPEKKQTDKPKPKPPASKAGETAKSAVTQSNRNAASAPSASSGASSQASVAQWETKVRSAISRRKPRSLRGNGLGPSTVRFQVADNGALSGVSIIRSTGDTSVDRQILTWVSGVGRVAPPPPGAAKTVTIPITIR